MMAASEPNSRRPAPRRLATRRPRLPHSRATKKNLHFSEHVTTASPNPFRLVVEGLRASTHAPPTPPINTHPAPDNTHVPTSPVLRDVEKSLPSSPRRKYAPTTTNAHTIAPPHSLTHGPSSSTITTTTTTAPPLAPHTPTPRYEYDSLHNEHTILYSPTTDATAYIHTLGRSHAVPVLLPLPPTQPRTYFLNNGHDREGDSVEIQRGDASRPRISIHTPSPHQTDIYPSPRPPLFRIA
ncbi:hypothetical protein E2C01_023133 [Portunus trituberculatus]|uniref:Uncharacterized protein n=1 Tax=Portunus trituberculatus TaxID=210409 RepID=A0A5B7E785_PORTR|nr:hypothetical protein [Portunus trituberculatus]